MVPFPIVIINIFGSKKLISYSYPHTLETRGEDNFNSRSSQQLSLGSRYLLPIEFGRPTDAAGAGQHDAHGPYTFKHLSIWAYLAFGLIVLWISFVTVYACFRCCRAHIVRLDISDDENTQIWKKRSAAASKRKEHSHIWGWMGEISAASSEVCWQEISRMWL